MLFYFIYDEYEIGDELIVMDSTILPPPTPVDTGFVDTTTTGIVYSGFKYARQIFPNPAGDVLNIYLENIHKEEVEIRLFDLKGRSIYFEKEDKERRLCN